MPYYEFSREQLEKIKEHARRGGLKTASRPGHMASLGRKNGAGEKVHREMIALRASGVSCKEIAAKFDFTEVGVYKVIRRYREKDLGARIQGQK